MFADSKGGEVLQRQGTLSGTYSFAGAVPRWLAYRGERIDINPLFLQDLGYVDRIDSLVAFSGHQQHHLRTVVDTPRCGHHLGCCYPFPCWHPLPRALTTLSRLVRTRSFSLFQKPSKLKLVIRWSINSSQK